MANLRKLIHVVALGKLGTFALAADAVHLSQPAFSRSIQSIEEEYGVKLFQRGGRKIIPTPYGKIVIARAQKILQEAKGLKRDIELMKSHEYGEVLIGVGPIPAAILLVPVISELARMHPKIRTRVEVTHWQNLLKLLDTESLDLFIADTRDLMTTERLAITPLPKLPITCFCRAGHPILEYPEVKVEELRKYSLASFKFPDASLAEVTKEFLSDGDPRTLWSIECDNLLVLGQIALSTDVIILGPEAAFRTQVKEKKLVEINIKPSLQLVTHFGIVTLKDRMLSPAAEIFIQIVSKHLTFETPQSKERTLKKHKRSVSGTLE